MYLTNDLVQETAKKHGLTADFSSSNDMSTLVLHAAAGHKLLTMYRTLQFGREWITEIKWPACDSGNARTVKTMQAALACVAELAALVDENFA